MLKYCKDLLVPNKRSKDNNYLIAKKQTNQISQAGERIYNSKQLAIEVALEVWKVVLHTFDNAKLMWNIWVFILPVHMCTQDVMPPYPVI